MKQIAKLVKRFVQRFVHTAYRELAHIPHLKWCTLKGATVLLVSTATLIDENPIYSISRMFTICGKTLSAVVIAVSRPRNVLVANLENCLVGLGQALG